MWNNMVDCSIKGLKFIPYGIFNINCEIDGNGTQINDNLLLYGSENLLVAFDFNSGDSFIVQTMSLDGMVINKLLVNEDRSLIAVSQKGHQALITVFSIFNYPTLKFKEMCVFLSSSRNTKEYSRLKFSSDSFYLGAISGGLDSHIVIYNLQTGHIVFNVSFVINQVVVEIVDLAFNSHERCKIVVVGNGILNIFSFSQGKFRRKALGGSHINKLTLVSVVWMFGDRIIAGTNDGRVVITENGIFQGIFNILGDDIIYYCLQSKTSPKDIEACDQTSLSVISVIPLLRGFLLYCRLGIVVFEQYSEGWFKRRDLFRIRYLDLKTDNKRTWSIQYFKGKITISVSEKEIMLLEIHEYHIEWIETYVFMYHDGPVSSLSTSIFQPFVVSSGKFDRRLVLWNYKSSLALKYWIFDSSIIHLAFHPSGLFCLVVFAEKFCFCCINVNEYCLDILDYFMYSVDVGTFSESGGVFAVGNSVSIDVYSSLTLNKKKTIITHVASSMLTCLCFTDGDRYIWSCSVKADVRKWHIFKGLVCWETQAVSCSDNTLAVQRDNVIHLVDDTGTLIEINDFTVRKRLNTCRRIQCITRSADAVILGDKEGCLSFLTFAVQKRNYCLEQIFINKSGISQILALEKNYIMVASNDGGVYMSVFFLDIPVPSNSTNRLLPCLKKVLFENGHSLLPRNNFIVNDCLKQLAGSMEKHKKKIFWEEDSYSIHQINYVIERVLKNLFFAKAIAYYYRQTIRAFEFYANRCSELSHLCIGRTNTLYKKRKKEFFQMLIRNRGLRNLTRPINMLMHFINVKFINLYKHTKRVIQKSISKAVHLSRKRINQVLNKILTLNSNLSKYFYISNNPLNFIRFSFCSLFQKRLIKRNKLQRRRVWEKEMLKLIKLEKRIFIKIISQMKINAVLFKPIFTKPIIQADQIQ